MSNTITYKPLFDLNILHHYFLDNGATIFVNTTTPEVFSGHNVKNYLHVSPSLATEKLLKENKMLFKATTSGVSCLIATKSFTDLTPSRDLKNVILNFLIYVKDPLFGNYTKHSGEVNDVYYFANHSNNAITELNTLGKLNELSDVATPLDSYKVAYARTKSNDSTYEKLMASLSPEEQRGLFGVVSIELEDLLSSDKVPEAVNELKIVFKNRKTTWVYVNKTEEEHRVLEQPFVKKGKITITKGAKNYPMGTPSDQLVFPEDKPIETRIYI